MGFIGMAALGTIFFLAKGLMVLFKLILLKNSGNIHKGQIIELKDTYKSQSADGIQHTYIYSIDVNINGIEKTIEYKEIVKGNKPSKFNAGMYVDVYFNSKTQNFDMANDLTETLHSSLLAVAIFAVITVISFAIAVTIFE